MQRGYTPPWHPPIPGGDPRDITALRAQRAEVDALLAFRHAAGTEAARAWWRLVLIRRERLAGMRATETASLARLPAPPPGALTFVQQVLLRLRRFRPETAKVPFHLR